jgi:2-oxoglutarate dehydrogenase E2 component (dihydrolipoamide succinyltransferase)
MGVEIVVPELSESVQEATVGRWLKEIGEPVREGEPLVELETDKVDLEVGSEVKGVLSRIERPQGTKVGAGDVLGVIDESATAEKPPEPPAAEPSAKPASPMPPAPEPQADGAPEAAAAPEPQPARAKTVEPHDGAPPPPRALRPSREREAPRIDENRREEREPLSQRKKTMARRLVEAQRTAAMLTTFNDADMSAVKALRERYREEFRKRHGTDLGILSFFVKASVAALKAFPRVNSELQGEELIVKHYYDVGIAVADARGLVVPVLRDCDRRSFPDIEKGIDDLAARAREGKLGIEDLRGGTFTISNGGVFGSLWSTPILNAPQVAILGLHRIQERPVAVSGRVEVRPMMYLALSYDHRVIEGEEAVRFLARIKTLVEDPVTLLFEA